MTKITKILIANRGEIACRVMKTARKLGIKTVAVYSDADKKALHTRMADEAVHIGASPAAESYLVIDKIIDACKQTGADAVHPGYGFLSENPAFVRACDAAGIIFIGPKAESMEAMGLKDAAKKLMVEAGVPVTPGYHGKDQSPDLLKSKAGMIGYPVLIKAVAGGGGKGMRKVEDPKDFISSLESCQREARSSFGDDRVLIEKYITSPRHIEVQVFGDTHGNVVHMFERDCSLQRRHQKVIEEAPAPGMTEDVRKAMTDAAVQAAKAVNYVGAGTVEFIVDGSGKLRTDGFWFMEMNTRLQVEHPVSERITMYDFVELQIHIAQGEHLPEQDDIQINGHAVEARLYAEDPTTGFLPSTGTLKHIDVDDYEFEDGFVRIDTGVETGDQVTHFYDPMIAKVIGHGADREAAISKCHAGISATGIDGLKSNAQFLLNCISHPAFEDGQLSTAFIETYSQSLIWPDLLNCDATYALAAAHIFSGMPDQMNYGYSKIPNFPKTPFAQKDGFRMNLPSSYVLWFQRDGQAFHVALIKDNPKSMILSVNGAKLLIEKDADYSDPNYYEIDTMLKSLSHWHFITEEDEISMVFEATLVPIPFYRSDSGTTTVSSNAITAPMPGKIIAVNAKPGASVKAGDPLIIMEAMKMEMTLEAPRDGVVAAVNVEANALVSDGDVLLEMAEED